MFKFAASDTREKSESTSSAVHIEEDRYAFKYTQEYKTLEGKLKHDSARKQLGIYWGVIGDKLESDWGVNTGSAHQLLGIVINNH